MGSEQYEFKLKPLPDETVQEEASELLHQFDQAFEEAGDLEKPDVETPQGIKLVRGDTEWNIHRQSTPDSQTLFISANRKTEKALSYGESTLEIRASEQSTTYPTVHHKSSWSIKPQGDGAYSETTPNTTRAIDNTKSLLTQFRQGNK